MAEVTVGGLDFGATDGNRIEALVRCRIEVLGEEVVISVPALVEADTDGLPDLRRAVRDAVGEVADELLDLHNKAQVLAQRPGSWPKA